MKTYIILISIAILVNLFGSTLYIGSPGLQYILTPLIVLISSVIILSALYQIKKSQFHIVLTLVILLITVLTGLPLWLQDYLASGHKMKILGQICYGIGIPLQVILLLISIKNRKRLLNIL
jgi:hypothetical protein